MSKLTVDTRTEGKVTALLKVGARPHTKYSGDPEYTCKYWREPTDGLGGKRKWEKGCLSGSCKKPTLKRGEKKKKRKRDYSSDRYSNASALTQKLYQTTNIRQQCSGYPLHYNYNPALLTAQDIRATFLSVMKE